MYGQFDGDLNALSADTVILNKSSDFDSSKFEEHVLHLVIYSLGSAPWSFQYVSRNLAYDVFLQLELMIS